MLLFMRKILMRNLHDRILLCSDLEIRLTSHFLILVKVNVKISFPTIGNHLFHAPF